MVFSAANRAVELTSAPQRLVSVCRGWGAETGGRRQSVGLDGTPFTLPPRLARFQYLFRGGCLAGRPLRGLLGRRAHWHVPVAAVARFDDGHALAGTDCANRPFWSPDSRSIAFNVPGGQMKRLDIVGGAAQVLGDTPGNPPTGAGAWGRDGTILFGTATALYRLSDTGGTPQPLTKSDASRQETDFRFPQFLQDGKRFLYCIGSPNPDVQGTFLGSLERPNERVRIVGGRDKTIYAPPRDGAPAYLLFLRDQSLLAQRFDVDANRLDGEPIRVTDGFPTSPGNREGFWLSDAGLLVYRIGGQNQNRKLTWIARGDGKRVAAPEGGTTSIRISPDGKGVALDAANGVEDLCRDSNSRAASEPF